MTPLPTGSALADRYHELMRYRREALSMHGASEFSLIAGPKTRISVPSISLSGAGKRRIGPFRFHDNAPIVAPIERVIRATRRRCSILEIGPGSGDLARSLQSHLGDRIASYVAFDRDASIAGPYRTLASIGDAPDDLDVVIASEVVEHMPADVLFERYLAPLAAKIAPTGSFIVSTPNPVSPGGIARDLTHVQHYPWYDLYALFRLAFADVVVYRTYYAFEPSRLLALVPRIVLCSLIELDWRDGLVCVASSPLRR